MYSSRFAEPDNCSPFACAYCHSLVASSQFLLCRFLPSLPCSMLLCQAWGVSKVLFAGPKAGRKDPFYLWIQFQGY